MKAFFGLLALVFSFAGEAASSSAATWQFSATPTAEEFLGARVFDEALVPVGGVPSPAENLELAAALKDMASHSLIHSFTDSRINDYGYFTGAAG